MAAGLALQAGGLGWVAWLASASGGYGRFVLPMIIAGVGISMALPTVATAALGAVAPPDMGRASGVNNTLQRFGGAFGIAVAAAVFSAHGQLGSPAGVTAGFRPALAVSALLSLLGAVAAVLAGRLDLPAVPLVAGWPCSPGSCCGSGVRKRRCCRWGCSGSGPSRRPTPAGS